METYLDIFCGVAVVLIVLYYYFTAHFNYWKSRGIAGPEPVPIFGNTFRPMVGLESKGDFLRKLYAKYRHEPMVGIYDKRTPLLVVQDPDLAKDILIRDFPKFTDRGFLKTEIAEPLSQHLFALEARRWRPLRNQFSPVFTSGKLKGTFSLILECADQLEKHLDALAAKEDSIDFCELAARFTTDVIGSCVFGIEMNSLSEKESDFRRTGKEIFATHWVAFLKDKLRECMPHVYDLLGYVLPQDEVTKFITKVTTETIEYRKANNIVRPDFMNTLLELKLHPQKISDVELTDNLLAAQAFVFFAAGSETSSTTISNALYELALNQEMQRKLRAEIKEFDTKNGGEWKYETLKQMTYLDKVFKETLRKYPPLPFLTRKTNESYTFAGTKLTIPKDMEVWVPVFAIQRDPFIYPNPEAFDPERFSEEAERARHPMHYMPFGDGPRKCIGERFAIYQTKVGIIKILRNYAVDVCNKTQIPYVYDPTAFVMCPKYGTHLKVTKDD